MNWNHLKWNQFKWNQFKWNHLKNHFKLFSLRWKGQCPLIMITVKYLLNSYHVWNTYSNLFQCPSSWWQIGINVTWYLFHQDNENHFRYFPSRECFCMTWLQLPWKAGGAKNKKRVAAKVTYLSVQMDTQSPLAWVRSGFPAIAASEEDPQWAGSGVSTPAKSPDPQSHLGHLVLPCLLAQAAPGTEKQVAIFFSCFLCFLC